MPSNFDEWVIRFAARTKRGPMTKRERAALTRMTWPKWISYAEAKLARAKLKVVQLEGIVETFKTQAKAGDPSPSDLALTRRSRPSRANSTNDANYR